jgi:hypothetical protein
VLGVSELLTLLLCKSNFRRSFFIGLADKNIYEKSPIGMTQHSYSIEKGCRKCYISGREFELPLSTIKPKCNGDGDVYGCGLLRNKSPHDLLLAIFFTLNGTLVGQLKGIIVKIEFLYQFYRPTNSYLQFGGTPLSDCHYVY